METTPYLLADVDDIEEVYYVDKDPVTKDEKLSLYQKGLIDFFNIQYKIIYRSIKLRKDININMFVAATGHYDESWKTRFYELCNIKNVPKLPMITFLSYCISLIQDYNDKKTAVCFSYKLPITARNVLWREKNLVRDTITTPESWFSKCQTTI